MADPTEGGTGASEQAQNVPEGNEGLGAEGPEGSDADHGQGVDGPSSPRFRADVVVDLKDGVTDAEGQNTLKALRLLGFDAVSGVRSAKHFHIELAAASADDARAQVERMCRRLLANPVVHDHSIDVHEVEG